MLIDLQRPKTLNENFSVKRYEHGGRLKVKFCSILFYGDNLRTVARRQMKSIAAQDRGHNYKFQLNHYFLTKL